MLTAIAEMKPGKDAGKSGLVAKILIKDLDVSVTSEGMRALSSVFIKASVMLAFVATTTARSSLSKCYSY